MSEQAKFTYHEAATAVHPDDALLYEATARHTMPHEINTTPEQQVAPGSWEQRYLEEATARLGHYRLLTLAESGNEEARRILEQRAAELQQLTQADVDLAA